MSDSTNTDVPADLVVRLSRDEADAICESWVGGKPDQHVLGMAISKLENALEGKPDAITESNPGETLRYRLAQHLNAAVRQLRDAEDIARMEMPRYPTADRIREIYEQVSADVLNGKTGVPPLAQRFQESEARASRLANVLMDRFGLTTTELTEIWDPKP
jgi:hypothetical protein